MTQAQKLGPYRLLKVLGHGGTGTVYLAFEEASGRHAALKILDPAAASKRRVADAFATEARLSRSLSHPNLVACLGVDLEAPRPWIAFEYVAGTSLAELLERQGRLEPDLAVSLLLEVAYGLAAAHQKSIVHGDIKPQNILVKPSGQVKLIDFGAAEARLLPENVTGAQLAVEDQTDAERPLRMLTPRYAAPEQVRGQDICAASDLYSLGLVLYEALTGEHALRNGSLPEIFLQQSRLVESLPRPSALHRDVPPELDEIFAGLVAFKPEHRTFRTALQLAEQFEALLRDRGARSEQDRCRSRLARLELAETDFWRARNLVEAGCYPEALALLRSLAGVGDDLGQFGAGKVAEELHDLLWHLLDRQLHGESSEACLCTLQQVLTLARDLGDADLVSLVERRAATVLTSIPSAAARIGPCTALLTAYPASILFGEVCLGIFLETGPPAALDSVRFQLLTLCIDVGDLRRAIHLAKRGEGAEPCARALQQARRRALAAVHSRTLACDEVRRKFVEVQTPADLAQCREAARRAGDDWKVLRDLAEVARGIDSDADVDDMLFEAGRGAFLAGALAEARGLLAAVLVRRPDHVRAYRFLLEILCATRSLPKDFRSPRRLRLAVFAMEGIEDGLAAELKRQAVGTEGYREFLELLLETARSAGSGPSIVEIRLCLGEATLRAGDAEAAREHLLAGLDLAHRPLAAFRRVLGMPGIRAVFPPEEQMHIRALLKSRLRRTAPRERPRVRRGDLAGPPEPEYSRVDTSDSEG